MSLIEVVVVMHRQKEIFPYILLKIHG